MTRIRGYSLNFRHLLGQRALERQPLQDDCPDALGVFVETDHSPEPVDPYASLHLVSRAFCPG